MVRHLTRDFVVEVLVRALVELSFARLQLLNNTFTLGFTCDIDGDEVLPLIVLSVDFLPESVIFLHFYLKLFANGVRCTCSDMVFFLPLLGQ